jgi:hypothetical protein
VKILAWMLLGVTGLAPLRAADTDSVDSVVRAVYDVISGPAGPRDWARFRSLFADGARLITLRVTDSAATPVVMTPDDYVQRAGANFANKCVL